MNDILKEQLRSSFCFVPEPLKQAVQNFRTASDRLDKIITETDFSQEKYEAKLATGTRFLVPCIPAYLCFCFVLSLVH